MHEGAICLVCLGIVYCLLFFKGTKKRTELNDCTDWYCLSCSTSTLMT